MELSQGLTTDPPAAGVSSAGAGLVSALIDQLPFLPNPASLKPPMRKTIAIFALVVNFVAFLTMYISLYNAYHLNAEDAVYGNNCGGAPPSAERLSTYVDAGGLATVTALAANVSESASAAKTNQADGEKCESRR
jgi:hypothetical protein